MNYKIDKIEIEYNFKQDYKTDVALLDNYGLQIIFEIYNTIPIPEPWY